MNLPGSQLSTTLKSQVNKMPVKKGGTAMMTWLTTVRHRSAAPP